MKFEKITDDKFVAFKSSQVVLSQSIYGGFTGETGRPGWTDQEKSGGTVDETAHGSGKRNDGFSNG